MALLRGANRPLLTRLIEQEVAIEAKENPRNEDTEIDFKYGIVICDSPHSLSKEAYFQRHSTWDALKAGQ